MKPILILMIAFVCLGFPLSAQIIIDHTDMPVVGDTLRVSVTNIAPTGYSKTAMDTIWNFSEMEAMNQRVDTFMSANASPAAYQLIFVLLGGANMASPLKSISIPGLTISQGFTFFKNSASSYCDLGSAYTIKGIPIPAKYDNPDKYYTFPLQPGTTWSSTASFSIAVPNTIYYSTQRFRTSVVDGWGTLITPFGTFETLRVKSTLYEHDSIFINSDSIGFPFNRNIIEYKWLGKGTGIPLLQVNQEGSILTATYRDSCRMSVQPLTVDLGPDTAVFKGSSVTLHANVSGGIPPYQIIWNTGDTGDSLTVTVHDTATYSVVVVDAVLNIQSDQVAVSIKYPPGMDEQVHGLTRVYPNPTPGLVHISLPGNSLNAVLQVYTPLGQMVGESIETPVNGEISTDLHNLPQGLYFVRISTNAGVYIGRIEVVK
jgi:hypothetical protein